MPIIKNTTDSLIVVPVDHRQATVVKFPPGYTHVDEKVWTESIYKPTDSHEIEQFGKEFKIGLAHFAKSRLDAKQLVVLTVKKGDKEKAVESLSELDAKDAEKVVADTHTSDVLKRWKEEEGRDSVRAAISNRLDKFNNKSLVE